ncbi:hypothetical protein CA85_00390 [Allorhodopirellula solitaria]|uniref:Uncharacterized protein n=1 Tax=Allorhodopirellula solitaria TaxID=2527987 RepID=A0A5C5YIQ8_9BACT|nr:hypothetical protein CA85_00390 [Allorhodopirellula solitaria]
MRRSYTLLSFPGYDPGDELSLYSAFLNLTVHRFGNFVVDRSADPSLLQIGIQCWSTLDTTVGN